MRSAALLAMACGVLSACADAETIAAPSQDLTVAEAPGSPALGSGGDYEITVENLTTLGGQWFTPPVVAIHRKAEDFFTVGKAASERLMALAENGAVPGFLGSLEASPHVSSSGVALGPVIDPLAPGESTTIALSAEPGANYASFASMLICTNDGFTGADGVKLPKALGEEIQVYVGAYDAGTETNTEDFADLVPPCQDLGGVSSEDEGTGESDPSLAEHGAVHHHEGITDRKDLISDVHGWTDPVAKLTIKRTG